MKRKNATRSALITSIISMLLCVSMLVGTTFAWFTDEVTSETNIIKSGTLDVAMEWANGKDAPASATWTDASTGAIFKSTLWEPGYTEARHIKITNKGTLALNWDLAIVPNGEVSALGDVIDVYCTKFAATQINDRDVTNLEYKGTLTEWISTGFATGKLDAGKEYSVTLVLKMREEAGNEYQNLSIGTDFAVKLMATQQAKEPDSFDNTYDKFAGKTVVTPETAQAAIWAAQEGDVIYLERGTYGTLVIENEDGSPKKGITIEHDQPGTNSISSPFSVGQINLNSSEDITIRGIYFDINNAQPSYNRAGEADYVASIAGAKTGANTGAKNIVIENCKFNGTSKAADNYVCISFEEQGKPTSRATNITVTNCKLDKQAFNFIRANYLADGTVTIEGNSLMGGAAHSAFNFTGNAANLMIRNNTFGYASAFTGAVYDKGWNTEKAMLGTSRQGSNKIMIEVTGNTFINEALGAEGHVIELKSSYTADNCELIFEGNKFQGGLAGMTEDTVPCIWHN